MPNTKAVGVAFSDPLIEGGQLDAQTLANSDLFANDYMSHQGGTIATTGNSDTYMIAPYACSVTAIIFSGTDALAASDTNYITWTITNLGQAGAGSAALLAATDANTTKTTGGTAISANTRRNMTISTTAANLVLAQGDRIRVRAAATGTLANTVTFPVYMLIITPV